MKIAYIGIDTLDAALKTLLQCENCEIIRIFTCRTDNKTEFNTETIALAEAHHILWTDRRIREADMEALKAEGCEGVICTASGYEIPRGILPVVYIRSSEFSEKLSHCPEKLLRELMADLHDCSDHVQSRTDLPTEEIKLSHEAKINRLLLMTHNDSSAYAFPSLFIWQKAFGLRVAFYRDCFIVKYTRHGENTWFFPVGKAEDCRDFLAEHMDEPDFSLHYVLENQLALLQQWFPGRFHAEEAPNDAEYICDIEGHMRLDGRVYANVRKQLHKANRNGTITLTPLGAEDTAYAENLLEEWQSRKKKIDLPVAIIIPILRYAEALHMELYFAHLDAEICGIIGGFPLSGNCFDGCIVILRENLPGLSYAVKNLFFQKLRDRYTYVNIEEDLGIPGLRLMKQKLVPVRMNQTWTVYFNYEA